MRCVTERCGTVVHGFARFLYWGSLLLLVGGIWVLVGPLNRVGGRTVHLYMTLGAFEAYIWMLLVLGRWQMRKGLAADAGRSAVFAAVLSGLVFVALNEFHTASKTEARWVSGAAVALTVIRLAVARRWLIFPLPAPMFAACCGWLVILAAPAGVLRYWPYENRPAQHACAYLICWVVALWASCHVFLAAWQIRTRRTAREAALHRWWTPWVLLAILAGVTVLQLYAVMWSMFIGWAQWYFTPVFLAGALASVCLAHARKRHLTASWLLVAAAVAHAVAAAAGPAPGLLPVDRIEAVIPYATHPLYPSALLATLTLTVAVSLLRRRWFLAAALAPPAAVGTAETVRILRSSPYGKGAAMLLGAFALLGLGAAMQWWQERRLRIGSTSRQTKPPPLPTVAERP